MGKAPPSPPGCGSVSPPPAPSVVQRKLGNQGHWDLPGFRARALKEDLVAGDPEAVMSSFTLWFWSCHGLLVEEPAQSQRVV